MFKIKAVILLPLLVGLAGCASSLDGDTYTRGQTRQAQNVQMATVESVRPLAKPAIILMRQFYVSAFVYVIGCLIGLQNLQLTGQFRVARQIRIHID